jgi:signal transduction histidine kinase
MNAIIGFAQILLRPKFSQLSSVQTDILKRILNNAKNLSMLLNEVLDFSKIDSGRLALKPEIFDLSKVVNHAVSEIRSLVEAKKLSLSVEIELENTLVFNDPRRVSQILINLLSNAIKFTECGCIWVRVTQPSKNRIAISIRDTGIGISSQDCEHIFEAFRQVDQGISRKYPGTGLGLAIIDSLVKIMGGKIILESELAVGSLFRVELPRQVSVNLASEEKLSYFDKKGPSMSFLEKRSARY